MPGSESLREEVVFYFAERFGVSEEAFSGIVFSERKSEIWAASVIPPPAIFGTRPPGLRALRRMRDKLKPTSLFLRFLGDRITSSRVEITAVEELRTLLLGGGLPSKLSPGYVAISFRGDVIGCGSVNAGYVKAILPTGRKKELLEILEADCDFHHGNLARDSGKIVLDRGGNE